MYRLTARFNDPVSALLVYNFFSYGERNKKTDFYQKYAKGKIISVIVKLIFTQWDKFHFIPKNKV